MNATKRKFNTLLQGLGTPRPDSSSSSRPESSTSRPASAAAATPTTTATATAAKSPRTSQDVETLLQKRRRLGLPQSNGTGSTTSTPSPARAAGSPSARAVTTKPKVAEQKPLSRFCPSDRGELLKRLATFHDITDWTPKPDRVSEIEWAKRGWVCHGKETVRCVLCHKELVVKLNKKHVDGEEVSVLVPSEIESALVDKYAELIVDSHLDDCLWRKRGCDDTLLRLHLASAPTAIAELKERYEELCSRKSFLPYEFNLRLPDDLDLDQALSDLPPDFTQTSNTEGTGTGTDTDAAPNRVALALALMGWQGLSNTRIGAVPNSASCHTCLRRLGLWMFKSKEVGDDGAVLVPAPMDHLDAVREHRFFCPWKNADAQKLSSTARVSFDGDDGPRPGWRILQQTLRNDAHLRSVYAGQKRSSRPLFAPAATASKPPDTPTKGGTPQKQQQTEEPRTPANGAAAAAEAETLETPAATAEDDEKEQETKDKERWARLKRVKSLFDMKGSRRLSRASSSRPGTSRPGTSQSIRETPQE